MQLGVLNIFFKQPPSEEVVEETGAAIVKVPSVKKSRTWKNNMSDVLDRRYEC